MTVAGPARARRGPELRDLDIVADGAIAIRDGLIQWVGATDQLPDRNVAEFDASGKVVLPGFVDSHTHAVFAGTRAVRCHRSGVWKLREDDDRQWRRSGRNE